MMLILTKPATIEPLINLFMTMLMIYMRFHLHPDRVDGQTNPSTEGLTILAEGPSQRQPAVGHSLGEPTFSMTAQTARGVVHCCECNKPRLYYSRTKLTSKQNLLIAKCISKFTFTCGAPIAHPSYLSL
ncbi:uncharacterized protein LOC128246516 [Mya arenaria]|nr:uncharacterized protein LOC128246516 [Mya arenaria]